MPMTGSKVEQLRCSAKTQMQPFGHLDCRAQVGRQKEEECDLAIHDCRRRSCVQVLACYQATTWQSKLPCCEKPHSAAFFRAPRLAPCRGLMPAAPSRCALPAAWPPCTEVCAYMYMCVLGGRHASKDCPAKLAFVRAIAVQVYDLLVACGWMIGSHASASSAAVHRADGQPGPGSAAIVKCDPLEGQISQTGFSTSLQGFPGFHIGSYQL